MRDIIVTEFISLDGVVDSPGGEPGYRHAGWTFDVEPDPAVYEIKAREAEEAEALLLGRRSYDAFSAVWPEREEFASFNAMPKYVVSSTLTDPTWHNTRVLPSLDDVAELRAGTGGPILVVGSATLAQGLAKAGLVDQWNLLVFPVILGSGLRLFPTDAEDKIALTLVETATYRNGVQLQVLRPQGTPEVSRAD
jgi:dihydrofolate reductase